jgi:uncharacterized protein YndB with AHSA1/START domain
MKWILIGGVVLVAIAVVVVVIGLLLPESHIATRRASIPSSCEAVFAAITDVEQFSTWRHDVKRVERLPDREGRAVWIEEGSSGRMTLAVEHVDRPTLLVTRIADPDLPFGGTWTYNLQPGPESCEVTITEKGEIYNPLFRFMARFVFGYEATMASYLEALGSKFGSPSRSQ